MDFLKIEPSIENIHEWEDYAGALLIEWQQCRDEGRDVEGLRELAGDIKKLPVSGQRGQMARLFWELCMQAPLRGDYPYAEPDELDEIISLCASDASSYPGVMQSLTEEQIRDKVKGAWYGRIIGCFLGKPIEGFWRETELVPLLKLMGNYPLHRYLLQADVTEAVEKAFDFDVKNRCYADTVACAPADDDTNYTVLAQTLIETYGADFKTEQVAKHWLNNLPKDACCTAERRVYINLINGYSVPAAAHYKNPYREWIGAAIRGDYFGYISPGDPARAVRMAYEDARLCHVKNGIYGEMFVSAMLALSWVCEKTDRLIEETLAYIPATCRLYEGVARVLQEWRDGKSYDRMMQEFYERWDDKNMHDWDHTIPNLILISIQLLFGEGKFAETICRVVQAGFDTDSNAAICGSVLGMMKGYAGIPEEWLAPLNDQLTTNIMNVGTVKIEQLVDTTIRHIRSLDAVRQEH